MVTKRTNYYITIAAKKVLSQDTLFSRALQEVEVGQQHMAKTPGRCLNSLPHDHASKMLQVYQQTLADATAVGRRY